LIINKSKEAWEIRKIHKETSIEIILDEREFTIFRTFLNKYKKDLEIVFTTKKKFFKLNPKRQEELRWKYEEDGNKIRFLKYLWNEVKKTRGCECSKCSEKTKYLYMFCTNIKYIKEFRSPNFKLLCGKCWRDINTPVNID